MTHELTWFRHVVFFIRNFVLQKLYGPKYVWFFIGWYEDDWFKNEAKLRSEGIKCSAAQMAEAAEGHFTTEALMRKQDSAPTISGRTVEEFDRELKNVMLRTKRMQASSTLDPDVMPEGYLEAPLAYDAVWAVALGNWLDIGTVPLSISARRTINIRRLADQSTLGSL